MTKTIKYQVIDKFTKEVIGTYVTRQRARRKADLLDNVYGAIRYFVMEVVT